MLRLYLVVLLRLDKPSIRNTKENMFEYDTTKHETKRIVIRKKMSAHEEIKRCDDD